jgi:hypothetical protein
MEAFREAGTSALLADCEAHPARDVFGNDVDSTPDSYMADRLLWMDLSPEALKVLTLMDRLWAISLAKREAYAEANPHLHLHAWDAGCYQLKNLWRSEYPEEWAELRAAFKALSDKLRPGVHKFGFLPHPAVLYSR